jgi:hypothetical protein
MDFSGGSPSPVLRAVDQEKREEKNTTWNYLLQTNTYTFVSVQTIFKRGG